MTDNQTREMFDKLTKCVNGIQTLRDELAFVKSDVVEIKSDIVEIKSDIVEMKSDIVEIKSDIVEIKADVVEIKADVEGLKTSQSRMERQINFSSCVRRFSGRQCADKSACQHFGRIG